MREQEMRWIECPACDGGGGRETVTGYDPRNGNLTGYWTACDVCKGRREIEIEVEPLTLTDLEKIE